MGPERYGLIPIGLFGLAEDMTDSQRYDRYYSDLIEPLVRIDLTLIFPLLFRTERIQSKLSSFLFRTERIRFETPFEQNGSDRSFVLVV
jgi:hypothetical protein